MVAVLDFGPDDATFDPPITITMEYDPEELPEGVSPEDLVLAYYDDDLGEWVELTDITVDPSNNTVSGLTSHFTQFAVLAQVEVEPPVEQTPAVETPEPTVEPISDFDEDDDGLHPMFIIGPIIGLVIAGLIVVFTLRRRRGYL